MPTNYTLPTIGTVNLGGYLGVPNQDTPYGIFPSVLQQGSFQEMPTLQDMYEITVQVSGADIPNNNWGTPVITDDGWGSGRRRVGMLVYVLENQKLYNLVPNGYFGNGGELGVSDWIALTGAQKYELLDPTALYNASGNPFTGYTPNTPTGTSADCWVELTLGGGADEITYDPQTGTLSLYDGTTLIDSTKIHSGNLFKFRALGANAFAIDDDTDYQGGAAANQNPTIYVTRGETYTFRREEAGHPLEIRDSNDNIYKMVLIGLISLLLMQAFVHVGVNLRVLPTTGMTLPYLSYGGSSIISISIISGIILNLTKRRVIN